MAEQASKPWVSKLKIENFKSIKSLQDLELGSINVLIGPNGAGKSNLISFFKMINWIATSPQGFQLDYIARNGKAQGLLYKGTRVSTHILGSLEIGTNSGDYGYRFRLGLVGADNLIFTSEEVTSNQLNTHDTDWRQLIELGSPTSKLAEYKQDIVLTNVNLLLKSIRVYQFHETGPNSPMRQSWDIRDGAFLKDNGQNLAAFLYNQKENNYKQYELIVNVIRKIVPNFIDFHFEVQGSQVSLKWQEAGADYHYSTYQASDGMLRFWCLVSVLYQQADQLPAIIIIDEPELGLHPAAIKYLVELIKRASNYCQVFVSTQSTILLDEFELEQIIVVENSPNGSSYKRLVKEEFSVWLEEYTKPSQLWESELIGGRP